ncbi:DUF4271 domain-containing protein [Bacteroidota bacterium]
MYNRKKSIDFFSAAQDFIARQDTVEITSTAAQVAEQDTFIENQGFVKRDTTKVNTFGKIDFSAIDSILRRSEEREKLIQEQIQREAALQRWYRRKIDTTEILYKQFGITSFPILKELEQDPFQQNFLYNIPSVKPSEKQVKQTVFIETDGTTPKKSTNQRTELNKEIKLKYLPGKIQFDWITIILIVSFLLLGWIRLFNKKYLISLIKSTISFQESNTLYREKNSLMERASFMVNLLYLSNISVFVVQLRHYWQMKLEGLDDSLLYFIVLCFLIALYIFRAITSLFIGSVFLKQKVFSEYFHNVNIFSKNTGLFLFPVVVTLQFLSYQYLPFIIYTGIILVAVLYLLQVVRSFQIIIRKNVSIFYMILYLCAFEFAPFLIIYKILLSFA